jgi:hypothetical protein
LETALTAYPSNTLGETFVRYAQLSGQNILSALSESHMVISAIAKYQASLASSTALPKDDTARIELTAANVKWSRKFKPRLGRLNMNSIVRKPPKSRDIKKRIVAARMAPARWW